MRPTPKPATHHCTERQGDSKSRCDALAWPSNAPVDLPDLSLALVALVALVGCLVGCLGGCLGGGRLGRVGMAAQLLDLGANPDALNHELELPIDVAGQMLGKQVTTGSSAWVKCLQRKSPL